jgi:hypothetical protein
VNVRAIFRRSETRTSSVDIKELLLDVNRIVSADARTKKIFCRWRYPILCQ